MHSTGTRCSVAAMGLEPDRAHAEAMLAAASAFVTDFLTTGAAPAAPVADFGAAPGEDPGDFDRLLGTIGRAAAQADDTTGPGTFAYFPGGGLFTSAVAELLACTVNRYTGMSAMAPALVAMEEGVLRWLGREFGLPDGGGGLVTSGTSAGTLSALVAARHTVLGGPPRTGTIYVTEHTHHCVAKAARIAGFAADQVRLVPVRDGERMDAAAAEAAIAADRATGRRPFVLVGTAGTTNTGAVDPLADLAEVARRTGVWFHVDAAYGGGFQLTERGRAKLAGIEHADSITLDAHKSLFVPYTAGVLLVRDREALRAAHGADADYLQDLDQDTGLPDYADLGVELSRGFRGLRLWLPLHLHGVGAFRAALDEKLDLAAAAHRELLGMPLLAPSVPDLTVLVFRAPGGDEVNRRLLERIHAGRRIALSSTRIGGAYTLRMCVLNHRTHREHVDEALRIIGKAVCGSGSTTGTGRPPPGPAARRRARTTR